MPIQKFIWTCLSVKSSGEIGRKWHLCFFWQLVKEGVFMCIYTPTSMQYCPGASLGVNLTFLMESPLTATLPQSTKLSTSNFTSQDTQEAFISSPLNVRWSQWPSLHPIWNSPWGKSKAISWNRRYALCWHWKSHWVTGNRERFHSNCFV